MPDFSVYIAAIAAPYLFCALAGMLLGRCDAALRRLILACLWAAMLGSEGVKLAVLWSGNVQPPYVPLHFSSTFHLSAGLAVCARGRAKHAGQVLLFAGGLIMTAMIAVSPVSVLGDPLQMFSSHVHAHGYFFHMQVALQFFALVFSGEYTIRPLDGHRFLFARRELHGNFAALHPLLPPAARRLRLSPVPDRILCLRRARGVGRTVRALLLATEGAEQAAENSDRFPVKAPRGALLSCGTFGKKRQKGWKTDAAHGILAVRRDKKLRPAPR